MSAMGEGSFFGKLMGSISTRIVPDLTSLAGGITKLSDASKTIELQKFLDMGTGLSHLHEPLYEFSKSGVAANFVGSEAITDVAKGITALNKTEVNRLGIVSAGMLTIDKNMFEVIKTAFAANFVGSEAITDISDGVTYLNKTEVGNMKIVAAGLNTIEGPLKTMTAIGFAANFVGKGAIIDIADGASHLARELGTDDILKRTQLAVKSMNMMKVSLANFTTGTLWNSLKGVGGALLDFISGEDSPISQMKTIADDAEKLEKGANAIGSIATNLGKIGRLKFDGNNLNIKDFAEDLLESVPIIEGAIMGSPAGRWYGKEVKGLGSKEIPWTQAAKNIALIHTALKISSPSQSSGGAIEKGGSQSKIQDKLMASIDALTAQIAAMPAGGASINAPTNIHRAGDVHVAPSTVHPRLGSNGNSMAGGG